MRNKYSTKLSIIKSKLILPLICFFILCVYNSCKLFTHTPTEVSPTHVTVDTPQISWNVLFQPGTSLSDEQDLINKLINDINHYYDSLNQQTAQI